MEPNLYRQNHDFKMPVQWLTDEAYSAAIESLVIVCADVIFIDSTNPKTLLLAFRLAKPATGYWFVGGRVHAGESGKDAIRRIVERETGLAFLSERLTFVKMNRYVFSDRQQKPQDRGSDSLCYIFAVSLSPEERESMSKGLDSKEFDISKGLQSFDENAIEKNDIHPAIKELYALLFSNFSQ